MGQSAELLHGVCIDFWFSPCPDVPQCCWVVTWKYKSNKPLFFKFTVHWSLLSHYRKETNIVIVDRLVGHPENKPFCTHCYWVIDTFLLKTVDLFPKRNWFSTVKYLLQNICQITKPGLRPLPTVTVPFSALLSFQICLAILFPFRIPYLFECSCFLGLEPSLAKRELFV